EKLRYELAKLSGAERPAEAVSEISVELPAIDGAKPIERTDDLPDELKPFAEAAMQAYHKARKSHTLLKSAKTDKQREALRKELLAHIAENKRNWAIVDDFRVNNILPDKTEPLTASQLLTAASSLSRALKSIETQTDEAKREVILQKIAGYVSALQSAGREFNAKTDTRLRELNLIQ
ncbi:MAG: hypothetical protein RRY42_06705, partial [Mucinivorans sp.]